MTALRHSDADVRRAAAFALGWLDSRSREVVSALVEALEDHRCEWAAANALATTGVPRPAIPDLVKSLFFVLRKRRVLIVDAIRGVGAVGVESACRILVRRARKELAYARELRFGKPIGYMGPDARDALAVAIWALGELRACASVGVLQSALAEGAAHMETLDAIRKLGPRAAATLPGLLSLLDTTSKGVTNTVWWPGGSPVTPFERVVRAIASLGPTARSAEPLLMEAFGESTPREQVAIADALVHIGASASAAIPRLLDLLQRQDLQVAAASALRQIKGGTEAAIARLGAHAFR